MKYLFLFFLIFNFSFLNGQSKSFNVEWSEDKQLVSADKSFLIPNAGNFDENFIIDSCVETEEKITHEGVEYPLVKVEISSSSHPFYSGKERSGGTTGRIEKFNKKYKLKQ